MEFEAAEEHLIAVVNSSAELGVRAEAASAVLPAWESAIADWKRAPWASACCCS